MSPDREAALRDLFGEMDTALGAGLALDVRAVCKSLVDGPLDSVAVQAAGCALGRLLPGGKHAAVAR
ncbi:MAG TPA: hypothetical protein VGS19_29060 [Streptosporangiaceae bacterium]|nr:hypothetical protein [Streptosporangiaceae bacterium]